MVTKIVNIFRTHWYASLKIAQQNIMLVRQVFFKCTSIQRECHSIGPSSIFKNIAGISWFLHQTNKNYLKSTQVNFKLTQLIDGTFPRHFLKKLKQKGKNGILQEREQAKIVDVRKRNSRLSGKSSSTELGQFVVNLTRL